MTPSPSANGRPPAAWSSEALTRPCEEAAALGLTERVEHYFASDDPPTPDELTEAFWYACHGGQSPVAEYLLERGADLNWISTWDGLTPLDAARRSEAHDLVAWLTRRGGRPAAEVHGKA